MCNLKIEAMDRAGELPLEAKMNEEKFSKPLDNLSSAAVRGEAVAESQPNETLQALKDVTDVLDAFGDMPDGWISPKAWNSQAAQEKIDAARSVLARAADALDSQPTEIDDLEDLIVQHRIAITPENEGGFHAHVYGDDEVPAASGYGATPREAINAAFAATQPTVAAQKGSIGEDARFRELSALYRSSKLEERNESREALTSYIDSRAPAAPVAPIAPDGWKLVPIEPTIEMIAALGYAGDEVMAVGHGLISQGIADDYAAMLAAAPAPQQEGSEAGNG